MATRETQHDPDTVVETSTTHRGETLTPGTLLHWYRIEGILGTGGFGITYLARDTNLAREVAIKEYFPSGLARRERDGTVSVGTSEARAQFTWGLDRFISEGRTLARFDHPGIVGVIAVFEANDTAYLVMRYERGLPLSALLRREGSLGEARTRRLLAPVCDGLKAVHDEGFIHRDIKPANIVIRPDGSAVLLDFGSARIAAGQQTASLTSLVSPGYAPFEQYYSDGTRQGPWTDVYALGATAYRMLTGVAPPPAIDRSKAVVESGADPLVRLADIDTLSASAAFRKAVDWALAFRAEDRPQNLLDWCRSWRPDGTAHAGDAGAKADASPVKATSSNDAAHDPAPILASAGPADTAAASPPPRARLSRRRHTVAFLAGLMVSVVAARLLLPVAPVTPDAPARDTAPARASGPGIVISETVETGAIVQVNPTGPRRRAKGSAPKATADVVEGPEREPGG